MHASAGGAEREGEKAKQAPHCQPDQGLKPTSQTMRSWPKPKPRVWRSTNWATQGPLDWRTFWYRDLSYIVGCLASNIPGLYPVDASSTPLETIRGVSRHCQMSLQDEIHSQPFQNHWCKLFTNFPNNLMGLVVSNSLSAVETESQGKNNTGYKWQNQYLTIIQCDPTANWVLFQLRNSFFFLSTELVNNNLGVRNREHMPERSKKFGSRLWGQ